MGGSRSGVSFHKHADAWNGVIYGRKRWFIYLVEQTPPGGKTHHFLNFIQCLLKLLLYCVLNA